MSKARDMLLSLTLVALVFTGPAAVAAYLLSGDRSDLPLMLAATSDGASAAVGGTSNPDGNQSRAPVLAGVLYTAGTPQVDWNGVNIPVANGSYAYLGGEVVSSGPADMSVLQLDADNSVYMCPDSRMSVTRADDGAYHIRIFPGRRSFRLRRGHDIPHRGQPGGVFPERRRRIGSHGGGGDGVSGPPGRSGVRVQQQHGRGRLPLGR